MELPREAREGLMRAWIKVLSDRHPNVTWIPAHDPDGKSTPVAQGQSAELHELATSA